MRKMTAISVAFVALAVGGSAVANGTTRLTARTRAAVARTTTVRVYTALAQAALIDVGQPGFSVGDQDVFSDNVLTRRNGAKLGVDGGVCTVVRVTKASTRAGIDQCLITFSLTGGEITTQVLQPSGQATGTATGVITGGTGRYRNAHGVYTVSFANAAAASVKFSFGQ